MNLITSKRAEFFVLPFFVASRPFSGSPIRPLASLPVALQVLRYYCCPVVDDRWFRDCGIRGKSEHMKAACRAKARATDSESSG